jgi:hypothetical protein
VAGGWKEGREERRTPWGRACQAVGDGGQLVPDGVRLQLLLLRRRRRRRHLRALRCALALRFLLLLLTPSPVFVGRERKGASEKYYRLVNLVVAMRYLNFEATGRGGAGAGTRQRTNGRQGTDDSAVTHARSGCGCGCHCHPRTSHPTATATAPPRPRAEAEQ